MRVMNAYMQIGMNGESLGLYTATGSSAATWGAVTGKQPLTWYKVRMIFALMKAKG